MSGYDVVLLVHSWVRWVVVAVGVVVVARSFAGWRAARSWSPLDERLHAGFVGGLDLQLTLGVVLYLFLSPIARAIFTYPAAAFREPMLRFFGLEHVLGMVVGIAVAHVGRARSKRAEGRARHRVVLGWSIAALLLVLASIPWPFLKYGRPLVRTGRAALELLDGEEPQVVDRVAGLAGALLVPEPDPDGDARAEQRQRRLWVELVLGPDRES